MRKGQNVALEQVFIFTIGLIVFIGIYFSFLTVSNNVEEVTKEDQIYGMGEFLSSCVVRSYLGPKNNTMTYRIPKDISEKSYKVYLDDNVLKLEFGNQTYNFTFGENYNLNGRFSSRVGKITIKKEQNQISVEKYEY